VQIPPESVAPQATKKSQNSPARQVPGAPRVPQTPLGAWHGRPGRQSSYCAVGVAAWPVEAAPGPSPAIAPMTIGSHARPAYVSNSFGSSPETSNRRS
jgi:hypothetical protein